MRKFVWLTVILLFVLHQDVWYWDDRTLVLDFLPIGLAYHVAFSIAAAAAWWLAVKFAWPSEIEAWADAPAPEGPDTS